MRLIRNNVVFGIAAVSLIGSANTAFAKDELPPMKSEFQRHYAKDGRGDTVEFRAERPSFERPERQGTEARPSPSEVFSKQEMAPIKAEVALRVNSENDGRTDSTKRTIDTMRPVENKPEVVATREAMPPMKTEVMLKARGERGTEETTEFKIEPKKEASTSTESRRASLQKKEEMPPIKIQFLMKGAGKLLGDDDDDK